MHSKQTWAALVCMLIGCGSDPVVVDESDPWQPGEIEDARDAPAEKIDAWEPRLGRERPIVAVLALNLGVELADYVTPYGVLAQSQAAEVLSVSTEEGLTEMRPLRVQAELTIEQFDRAHADGADYVIVPLVMDSEDPRLLGWIKAQADKGATIVSICLGATAVANTGLMDGHRATSHWSNEAVRATKYPNVRWQKNARWVADGKIVSSAGISAAIPISIALVEAIAGQDRAATLAEELGVEDWGSQHDSDLFQLRPGEAPPAMGPAMTDARLALPLNGGMDEISLALTADAYTHSREVTLYPVADSLDLVTTLSGVQLAPAMTRTEAAKVDPVLAYEEIEPATHALDVALHAIAAEYGQPAACRAARTMEHPSYAECP